MPYINLHPFHGWVYISPKKDSELSSISIFGLRKHHLPPHVHLQKSNMSRTKRGHFNPGKFFLVFPTSNHYFSGDSWMYPYQRTPMGNPGIGPKKSGYIHPCPLVHYFSGDLLVFLGGSTFSFEVRFIGASLQLPNLCLVTEWPPNGGSFEVGDVSSDRFVHNDNAALALAEIKKRFFWILMIESLI